MRKRDSSRTGSDEAIDAMAAEWLAEMDAGPDARKSEAFAQWRAQDPRHEAAVARLEATWNALQALRDYRPEAATHPDRDLLASPIGSSRLPRFPRFAGPLAAALTLLAGVWIWRSIAVDGGGLEVATAAGGYERVVLSEGSTLHLNGETRALVRLSLNERRVVVSQGQIHVNVTKDPVRPFVVEAAWVGVRAIGTAFSVRRDPERVEVIVTEGTVGIEQRGRTSLSLVAGERVTLARMPNSDATVERPGREEFRRAQSWMERPVFFSDTPLSEVVEQFNRHNRVRIRLGDPSLRSRPVGGSFRMDSMEAFVGLLAETGELTVDRPSPDEIVLLPSRTRKQ